MKVAGGDGGGDGSGGSGGGGGALLYGLKNVIVHLNHSE